MRRYFCVALAALLINFPVFACAIGFEDALSDTPAKAALVMHFESGELLSQSNADTDLPIGGLYRLPLLYAVCSAFDSGVVRADDAVRVSDAASGAKGQTAFLESGEVMPAGELLKAACMICAGDAIQALIETAYPSGTDSAVSRVLSDAGIDTPYSDDMALSAVELAKLGRLLAGSKSFCTYSPVYLDSITHDDGRSTELVNPNRLVKSFPGCNGIATGSSGEAGYCGVFHAERSGERYIAVVIGAADAKSRTKLAQELLETAFSTYTTMRFARAGETIVSEAPVSGAISNTVDLISIEDVSSVIMDADTYEKKLILPEVLSAPLLSTVPVGTVEFIDSRGNTAVSVQLYPAVDMPSAGITEFMHMLFSRWLSRR